MEIVVNLFNLVLEAEGNYNIKSSVLDDIENIYSTFIDMFNDYANDNIDLIDIKLELLNMMSYLLIEKEKYDDDNYIELNSIYDFIKDVYNTIDE